MKRTLSTSEPSSRRKRAPLVAYAAAAIALVLAVECGMLLIGHTHDKEDRLQPAGEIDVRDLFGNNDSREKILIFRIDPLV